MKKESIIKRFIATVILTAFWWGFIYPELAFTDDIVICVDEEGKPLDEDYDKMEFLTAGKEKIKIKLYFLEEWNWIRKD